MIVPMKKAVLLMLESEKEGALKKLRKMGLLHIEEMQGASKELLELQKRVAAFEACIAALSDKTDKRAQQNELNFNQAEQLCKSYFALEEQKQQTVSEIARRKAELEKYRQWGEIDPWEFDRLSEKGIVAGLYELPPSELKRCGQTNAVVLEKSKNSVKALLVSVDGMMLPEWAEKYRLTLPECSTGELKRKLEECESRLRCIDEQIQEIANCTESLKKAMHRLEKMAEFENLSSAVQGQELSEISDISMKIICFVGYIPTESADKLKALACESSWGITLCDPTEEDNVPTKIQNNKFVSLIYPLTDFLGTVPGYFEYDISAWFLGFILVFFGIIFGDGGYGLVVCAIAGAMILKARHDKKEIQPAFLLIALMGGATLLWGVLTCTWFGIPASSLPLWLQKISLPIISNVYADKIWYPPWTNGTVGLTTTQNVQIVCFALALVQLSAAHVMGMVRNRKSLKLLGDFGSVLQLMGIFYVVLSLVVNGAVFSLSLEIFGISMGALAVAFVAVGFVINFIFANYEGSIGKSIVANLKNIVSCLLGVVNVFSDIVSYIRLWAVGLAGSAISLTVNELAGPMLGNFVFMIFAIIILVFGHGLNMILNVLSLIVHGVRLNTLEFSTHLDMSWSGHKYKPFEE